MSPKLKARRLAGRVKHLCGVAATLPRFAHHIVKIV
jgi:hypothetical protein